MQCPLESLIHDYRLALAESDTAARYCSVATVDGQQASTRTVVLRDITTLGPMIFINDSSPKWPVLMAGGSEVLLFWPSQMRQYRLRGTWQVLGEDEMLEHWQNKPDAAKLLDHLYQRLPQSSTLTSAALLREELDGLRQRFAGADIPFVGNARGVVLAVDYLESWCAAADGVHQRRLYRRLNGDWLSEPLVP